MSESLADVVVAARACRLCAESLPLGPRPVLRAGPDARLLIVGQAPGTRAHETGLPWNDASGDRLRDWMGIGRDAFYDETRVALVPMGLCYPGRLPRGGDRPPRPECAPTWHARLRAGLPRIELTVLAGAYAQRHYLGSRGGASVAATVAAWRRFLPDRLPLPHPSWRTRGWVVRNPWFETDLLPELQARVAALTGDGDGA